MKTLVDQIHEASLDETLRADVRGFLAKIAATIRNPRADESLKFVAAVAGREALVEITKNAEKYRA